jgi:hypothetical protein
MAGAYYSLRDLAHDQKLAAALGDMVVAWAYAELSLMATQARILDVNLTLIQAGYYAIPTFGGRVKFTKALLREWEPDGFDKVAIEATVDALDGLASARNHWVHGDWCGNETEIVIFDHRREDTSPHRRKPVKPADVRNHVKAVLSRADTLNGLIDRGSIPA